MTPIVRGSLSGAFFYDRSAEISKDRNSDRNMTSQTARLKTVTI